MNPCGRFLRSIFWIVTFRVKFCDYVVKMIHPPSLRHLNQHKTCRTPSSITVTFALPWGSYMKYTYKMRILFCKPRPSTEFMHELCILSQTITYLSLTRYLGIPGIICSFINRSGPSGMPLPLTYSKFPKIQFYIEQTSI